MKTIILLTAMAAVAMAAPHFSETQFQFDSAPETSLSIHEREKKSPIIAPHIKPLFVKKPFIAKPIIVKKKVGYHLFRSSDEEQADLQEKCAKQIKVKLCEVNNMPSAKQALEDTHIEDINVHLVGDDMEESVKLAKEAVENLQRDLQKMGKSSDNTPQQDSWKSSADLHEDIEIARQALEHVHNSFGNLESLSLVAPATEDLMKTANLKSLTEEDEKLAQWHAAMENIQKNVEIARNIEDSPISASSASESQFHGSIKEAESKIGHLKKTFAHNQEDSHEQMKNSLKEITTEDKSESLAKNNEEEKELKHIDDAANDTAKVGINNKENVVKTSSGENIIKVKSELLQNINDEGKTTIPDIFERKEDANNFNKEDKTIVKSESLLKNNKEDKDLSLNPKTEEQAGKVEDMNTSATELKKMEVGSENTLNGTNPAFPDLATMHQMPENELVDLLLKFSNQSTTRNELETVNTDKNKNQTQLKEISKPGLEKMSLMSEEKFNEVPLLKKAMTLESSSENLKDKTEKYTLKNKENAMPVQKSSKDESVLTKKTSTLKVADNLEESKHENNLDTMKEKSTINLPKSAAQNNVEELSKSNEHNSSEEEKSLAHHNHHHHDMLKTSDSEKAHFEEKDVGMQMKTIEKKEKQLPFEKSIKTEEKSSMKEMNMDTHTKNIDLKHSSLTENKLDHMENINFKSAHASKLQELSQQEKHMPMEKSAGAEFAEMKPSQHQHGILHQKSTGQQLHEFKQRHHMNDDNRMMKSNSHLPSSFDTLGHARNTHFSEHMQMPERANSWNHAPGRTNMMKHTMDSAMQPSMQMNSMMDPMSRSMMDQKMMQWKHEGKSASYGAPESQGGSGGAVGLFPNAKVGNCAIPLLLSCNPSVVTGSLGTQHGSYSAPSYRAGNDFNYLKKRDTKAITEDNQKLKASTLFKNTSVKNKTS